MWNRLPPIALLVCLAVFGQTSPPGLVSPEVHGDRSATLRLYAPKASSAAFYGDWMPVGKTQTMNKDDQGVWSITVGPVPPSVYIYHFVVDGMTIADPVNPAMKIRARTSASLLTIPAETPAIWEAQDVPHGTVGITWEKAQSLNGETRWFWTYTPPGYEGGAGKYPVLYLFHGSNDTAAGWTLAGQMNFIMDNLIAQKKAVPMIVVMPFGHAVPFTAPRDAQVKNTAQFEAYLLRDVVPTVLAKYRIQPGREHTAIAGLSMGGGQSLTIGFDHPELFSSIGAFSAAVPQDFESRYAALLGNAADTNRKLHNVWIGCGRDDSLFPRSEKLSSILTKHDIHHTFRPSEGAHTYTVWRLYLSEFVPLLFH